MSWEKVKLSDLGIVKRGKSKHRPRNASFLYGGKYPFIQTSVVKNANLYISEYSKTYSEDGLKQSKLWDEGTLCITIAANIAESAILKFKACFPDSIIGFTPFPKKADIRFVKYLLDFYKINFQNISKGTTQDNLSVEKINSLVLDVPTLSTQRKIASILSAYDDLIENNTRRIKILEEMAQTIYKEWFVNFRFPAFAKAMAGRPGYEKVKFIDSPLSKIPEGWEVRKLSEIATIVMGQSPKSKFYNNNGLGLPFHQGVKDYGMRFPTHNTFCTVTKRIAEKNDILISVRAPVGRINVANTELIIGRGLSAIRHKKGYQSFLLYLLKNLFTNEDSMGSGAIYNAITKDDLYNIKVLIPNGNLDQRLNEIISKIDILIFNLELKNQNLRKTRDLLLPKLMNGEVDV